MKLAPETGDFFQPHVWDLDTYLFWSAHGQLIIMVCLMWVKVWSNFIYKHRYLHRNNKEVKF